MMLPSIAFLWFCLFTLSAESNVISQEPGKRVTLDCSDDGCPQSTNGYNGLYLYHEFTTKEEVLFISTLTPQHIVARQRYKGRIENLEIPFTFTISNLTKNDSGLYKCVYKKIDGSVVNCSVYAVFVTEIIPCSTPAPTPEKSPPMMLYIIFPCIICLLIIWIFFLLIIPKVKRWCCQRKNARRVSKECVYEDMRKNFSASPLEQSPQMF